MKSIMIILAYIAPFIFIPAVFRAAGGVFGQLTGMVNDRSRGFFDRQRKFRAGERERMKEQKLAGNRFQHATEDTRRGRFLTRMNRTMQRRAVMWGELRTGGVRGLGGRVDSEVDEMNDKKARELAQNGPAWTGNDTASWAANQTSRAGIIHELTQGEHADTDHYGNGTDADTPEQIAAREAQADEILALQQKHGLEVFRRANLIWRQKSGTAYQRRVWRDEATGEEVVRDDDTGTWNWYENRTDEHGQTQRVLTRQQRVARNPDGSYVDPEGTVARTEEDAAMAIRDVYDTYGNNASQAGRVIAVMKGMLQNSGQVTGAASFGTWFQAYDRVRGAATDNGRQFTDQEINQTIQLAAARDATPYLLAQGKPAGAQGVASAQKAEMLRLAQILNNPRSDQRQRQQAMENLVYMGASIQGLTESLNTAAPGMARVFSESFHDFTFPPIEVNMGPATVQATVNAPSGGVVTGVTTPTTPAAEPPRVLYGPDGRTPIVTITPEASPVTPGPAAAAPTGTLPDVTEVATTLAELNTLAARAPGLRQRWHTVRREWSGNPEQLEVISRMSGGPPGSPPGGPPGGPEGPEAQ